MRDLQQLMTELVVSFDAGGRQLTRYELVAARHDLLAIRDASADTTRVDWWVARVDNRLHFEDTGEYRPDPPQPAVPAEIVRGQEKRTWIGLAVVLAVLVLVIFAVIVQS